VKAHTNAWRKRRLFNAFNVGQVLALSTSIAQNPFEEMVIEKPG
jgi:hypothetical protein